MVWSPADKSGIYDLQLQWRDFLIRGCGEEDLALAMRYISSSRRLDETHTDGLRPFTARTREQRAHGERARGGEGDVCT